MSDVRTIFIGGLPRDCTERELHLLFYEGGGCEAIKLQHPAPHADPHSRYGRATAFVQFATRDRALAAASFIAGMVYDPLDPSSTLRVEMAKQDFRRVPGHRPPQNQYQYQWQTGAGGNMAIHHGTAKRQRSYAHEGHLSEKDASTLFIGSLNESVAKDEVEEFANSQEGLVAVTMKDEGSSRAVAWAQYSSPELAMAALANLHSVPIPSLGRAPNVEAARCNTGEKPGAVLAVMHSPAPVWGSYHPPGGGGGGGGRGSSTIFLGSLEPQVTEPELHSILSLQDGFVKLTSRGLGQPRGTAWAQFDSPVAAANACVALQQTPVPSMGRPANVELARSDIRN